MIATPLSRPAPPTKAGSRGTGSAAPLISKMWGGAKPGTWGVGVGGRFGVSPHGGDTMVTHINQPSPQNAPTGVSLGGPPPQPPASPPPAPSASASASPPQLDSTYYQLVAANQAKINSQIDALNQQQGYAQTGLQSQLAQLAHQEPLDQLRAMQAANSRGALYSTPYAQQQGQIAYNYLGREGAAQDNYGKLAASIASRIAGLKDSEQQYEAMQALASALRAAGVASKDPAAGETPVATPPVTAPATAAPATGGPAVGHSGRYQGAGVYKGHGPLNKLVRAIGHSGRYRGPGTYVRT